jgi:hypothetical protein
VSVFSLPRLCGGVELIRWLAPFATGATVLGNVVGCLALLILSSRPFAFRSSSNSCDAEYALWNVLNVSCLLVALVVGSVYAIREARNTAITFGLLWLLAKPSEVDWGGAAVVVAFLYFVALFAIGMWLSQNPGFVMSLFSPDGMYLVSAPSAGGEVGA